MDTLLSTEDLAFAYGGTPVWKDVSFSLAAGETVFLRGTNGAGKSTLLKCLAGQLRPSSGTVCLSVGPRELSFVSDVPRFYDDLTVQEHLLLLLHAAKRESAQASAHGLLQAFGLGRCLGQHPFTLSRGMRLKLALCLALATEPKLLLLDEPFGPLDQASSALLGKELARRAEEGAAVLASCHGPIPGLSPSRELILENGSIHER